MCEPLLPRQSVPEDSRMQFAREVSMTLKLHHKVLDMINFQRTVGEELLYMIRNIYINIGTRKSFTVQSVVL